MHGLYLVTGWGISLDTYFFVSLRNLVVSSPLRILMVVTYVD